MRGGPESQAPSLRPQVSGPEWRSPAGGVLLAIPLSKLLDEGKETVMMVSNLVGAFFLLAATAPPAPPQPASRAREAAVEAARAAALAEVRATRPDADRIARENAAQFTKPDQALVPRWTAMESALMELVSTDGGVRRAKVTLFHESLDAAEASLEGLVVVLSFDAGPSGAEKEGVEEGGDRDSGSDKPGKPEKPEKSDGPDQPDQPDQPAQPAQPVQPGGPDGGSEAAGVDDRASRVKEATLLAERLSRLQQAFASHEALATPDVAKARDAERRQADLAARQAKEKKAAEAAAKRKAERQAEKDRKARIVAAGRVAPLLHAVCERDKALGGNTHIHTRRLVRQAYDAAVELGRAPSSSAVSALRGRFDAVDGHLRAMINDGATRAHWRRIWNNSRCNLVNIRNLFESMLPEADEPRRVDP